MKYDKEKILREWKEKVEELAEKVEAYRAWATSPDRAYGEAGTEPVFGTYGWSHIPEEIRENQISRAFLYAEKENVEITPEMVLRLRHLPQEKWSDVEAIIHEMKNGTHTTQAEEKVEKEEKEEKEEQEREVNIEMIVTDVSITRREQ